MINYNLANEYIEKLIKLGITPTDVKTTFDNYNKSYIHYLKGIKSGAGDPTVNCIITITNNKNTAFTFSSVLELLRNLGCTSASNLYPATGYSTGNTMTGVEPFTIIGVYANSRLSMLHFVASNTNEYSVQSLLADKIVEI